MRGGLVALVLVAILAAPLAGCLDSGDINTTDGESIEEDPQNPWQKGLDAHFETPAGVITRVDSDRRADAYPPGAPEFTHFDTTIQAYMAAHDVPSGQIALFHNGALLYEQAYGTADHDGTPADPDTLFRIASVTKPITAALIDLQVKEGLYNWTDPVFCVGADPAPGCRLPIQPHPEHPIVDDRIADVQVGHLVNHTGGWGGSMTRLNHREGPHEVAETLGVKSPPELWRLAQYVMGESLVDDPGTTYSYCNICYMLLALVAESATGAELQALYDAYVFRPLEVEGEIELGRTLPADRNPRETHYRCEREVMSVYDRNKTVCEPDGGFAIELISSAGGLVSTATAVAAVYEAYPEFTWPHGFYMAGNNVYGPLYDWHGHTGAISGATSMSGIVTDHPSLAGTVQYVVHFSSSQPVRCANAEHNLGCQRAYFEQLIMNLAVGQGAMESDPLAQNHSYT